MAEQANNSNPFDTNAEMAAVMDRNIKEIIKLRQTEEKEKTSEERVADKITSFTGSMSFVYIHLVLFSLYIVWNAGLTPVTPVDAHFTWLGTIASVEAIFLSTFVLIRQNRMNKLEDKRAHLSLQVSLLAEHEVTRLLTLVSAIARKLDIEEAENPEYDDLKKEISPEKVLDTIDKHKKDIINENGIDY